MKKIKERSHNIISLAIFYFCLISVLLPIAILAIWSLADSWPWPALLPAALSLRGLQELLGGYSRALPVLFSSILISAGVALGSLFISIPGARAIALYDFHGKNLLKFVILLPVIVPVTAFAMGIQVLFIRLGLSDTILGVIIVHIILCLPYTMRILTEVTEAAGNKLESQARVLGASPFQTFRYVTFPVLIPGIVAAGSMAYIISFSQYFLTFLIGGGNILTFSMLMFPYIQSGDRTIASAYTVVFIGTSLLVFVLFEKILKRYYRIDDIYFFS